MSGIRYVATLVTALGYGLVASIFFPFSTFAMAGLRRLPPAQGIAAIRSINRPALSVVTPLNAQFGLHNLGADLPHTAFTGTGRWLRMDKPEEFDRILDEFLARVRATGALRSREPSK